MATISIIALIRDNALNFGEQNPLAGNWILSNPIMQLLEKAK
jgi:hypothetical protein